LFAADGLEVYDIKSRILKAQLRCGQLRNMLRSENLSTKLKVRLYVTAVCSLLTYGCEAWDLNEKTVALLNGANARCLSRFTGKDAHAEASARTRSFDLVLAIRKRRFKWLGHILRLPDQRLVRLAVHVQYEMNLPGNIFSDAPMTSSFAQLVRLAKDRNVWESHCPRTPKMRFNKSPLKRPTTTTAATCNNHKYPTRACTRA
jgi:hypothetical protein